jgi:predicted N-acyltransferase
MERGTTDAMRFSYGIVWVGARAAGIVPVFLTDVPLAAGAPPRMQRWLNRIERIAPQLLRARTLFVGSPTSVEGRIGLAADVDLADVMPVIAAAVQERAMHVRAALIAFKDFPDLSEPAFATLSEQFAYVPLHEYPGTRVTLPATWDAYLQTLCGRRRFRLRKKLRLSHEAAALTTEVVETLDDATLADLYARYRQTYDHAAHKFEELTPDFFRGIAEAPEARFVLLRDPESRKLVAFMLCFVIGNRGVNRFVGLDYTYVRAWNLHFRLWEAAARYFQSVGATDVHSGPTSYRFKIETGHDLVPMTTYVKHTNGVMHRFIAPLMQTSARNADWTTR